MGKDLPNAKKFEHMQKNMGGYSLNHCSSWQHNLPKPWVHV
jgi:hypothetical protein